MRPACTIDGNLFHALGCRVEKGQAMKVQIGLFRLIARKHGVSGDSLDGIVAGVEDRVHSSGRSSMVRQLFKADSFDFFVLRRRVSGASDCFLGAHEADVLEAFAAGVD